MKEITLFEVENPIVHFETRNIGLTFLYFRPLTEQAKQRCMQVIGWIPKEGIMGYVDGMKLVSAYIHNKTFNEVIENCLKERVNDE